MFCKLWLATPNFWLATAANRSFEDNRVSELEFGTRDGSFATEARELHHLYLTEQPYGLVFAFETVLPAMDSSSATFT